ncbi:MAG: class I tRNA ligase family protein, partial [Coriobacteriia bacterium]|nr:class I tRNA ligase family protein [Coriobacteriia bacterium]
MPYGNKNLHFGHVGGVFVPADVYARFLRDRIGKSNVIFVSGTDCYGSPIVEGFRKAQEEGFEGSIVDYVEHNHKLQKSALDAYDISLDLFGGSALGKSRIIHEQVSEDILEELHDHGDLEIKTSKQFYDTQAQMFLNGRQVEGHCPVQGCKSSKAYADECELGHQYEPEELINPISKLSNQTPEMREVANFYFNLPKYNEFIAQHISHSKDNPQIRALVTQTAEEFLQAPIIFIKNELIDTYQSIADSLPEHSFREAQKGKQSFEIEFSSYVERDKARDILSAHNIRFRTGKTILPFRLTGNIEWGVPAPELEGITDLTIWVWPESLWAPISFTQTLLQADMEQETHRYASDDWKDWWADDEAKIYQFIGQDNIYFYGVAQPALFEALNWDMQPSILVANHHILYLGKKASSSSDEKPPSAEELLAAYTAEQLRAHWISLGLDKKSVSFAPKAFDPSMRIHEGMSDREIQNIKRQADPAL